ncbi:hypothetical protein M9H77_30579 [Catharanthus roseus]|uniref:Uncharacterized protein n=1 Tax=Catharanthus roseus TaxID=4058 RepID=A0ACB9ZYY1_CATRO|nr:hypothetical protein M9H77_30579 [Catharanthus roseus]
MAWNRTFWKRPFDHSWGKVLNNIKKEEDGGMDDEKDGKIEVDGDFQFEIHQELLSHAIIDYANDDEMKCLLALIPKETQDLTKEKSYFNNGGHLCFIGVWVPPRGIVFNNVEVWVPPRGIVFNNMVSTICHIANSNGNSGTTVPGTPYDQACQRSYQLNQTLYQHS